MKKFGAEDDPQKGGVKLRLLNGLRKMRLTALTKLHREVALRQCEKLLANREKIYAWSDWEDKRVGRGEGGGGGGGVGRKGMYDFYILYNVPLIGVNSIHAVNFSLERF